MKIVVTSNCMTGGLTSAFRAIFPGAEVVPIPRVGHDEGVLVDHLETATHWIVSGPDEFIESTTRQVRPDGLTKVIFPEIYFNAFHPDQVYAWMRDGSLLEGATGPYHSAIVLWAWQHGLNADQTVFLFRPEVMEALGYHDRWNASVNRLRDDFSPFKHLDYRDFLEPLQRTGCFMHTVNHPTVSAIARLAKMLAGCVDGNRPLEHLPLETLLIDTLFNASFSWGVYPSVANSLGLVSDYLWKLEDHTLIDLREFVTQSLAKYDLQQPRDIDCHELVSPVYDKVLSTIVRGVYA